MLRYFFLDLASHSETPGEGACMACVSDERTEAIRFIDHRIGDDQLIPEFDAVLEEATWKPEEITHIACITGPGGFTSLRMAVTMANVLMDQLGVPMAGIHLSDVYAARATTHYSLLTTHFVWLHSTKRDSLFVRGFGEFAKKWPDAAQIGLEDLLKEIPAGAFITGELLPAQHEALAATGTRDLPLLSIADTLPRFLSSLSYAQKIVEPWYGRGW